MVGLPCTDRSPIHQSLSIRNTGGGLPLLDDGVSSSLIFSAIELARFISDENMHTLQNAMQDTYQQSVSQEEAVLIHIGNCDTIYVHTPLDQLASGLPKKALIDIGVLHGIVASMQDNKISIMRLFKSHLPCGRCHNYVCLYTPRDKSGIIHKSYKPRTLTRGVRVQRVFREVRTSQGQIFMSYILKSHSLHHCRLIVKKFVLSGRLLMILYLLNIMNLDVQCVGDIS